MNVASLRLCSSALLIFSLTPPSSFFFISSSPAAKYAVNVVLASGGYPGPYAKGKVITGLDATHQLPNHPDVAVSLQLWHLCVV